jgi:hypothetical protein
MNNSRLALLQQFFDEDPTDPFSGYALAMEYINTDASLSEKYLLELLENHPDYLPTYYQAATLLADSQSQEFIEAIYEKGLQLATAQNNSKIYQELQRAYRGYLDEIEE